MENDSTMLVYVVDSFKTKIPLELKPTDTLADLKKKLLMKSDKTDKVHKYMANGKVLDEIRAFSWQNLKNGDTIYKIPMMIN